MYDAESCFGDCSLEGVVEFSDDDLTLLPSKRHFKDQFSIILILIIHRLVCYVVFGSVFFFCFFKNTLDYVVRVTIDSCKDVGDEF